MNAPLNEFFNGLIQRSSIRQETVTGPGQATRISNVADFSATLHLSEHFRLVDTFRFWAYRIPESFNSIETDWTCINTVNLLVAHSDQHYHTERKRHRPSQLSFNQNWKRNEIDFVWDASKHFGGRIGFRYGDMVFHHILDFTTGDEDRVVIHEYTPFARILGKADAEPAFQFRLGTHQQRRCTRAHWTPQGRPLSHPGQLHSKALGCARSLDESLGRFERRCFNRLSRAQSQLWIHGDPYAAGTFRLRFRLQLQRLPCRMPSSALTTRTSLPVVANAGSCTANGYNDSKNPLLTNGYYTSNTHYGMASVMFKPPLAVTTQLGYSITSVGGQTPQFNALQPLRFTPIQLPPAAGQSSRRHWPQPDSKGGMELLPVRGKILCGTYRSALFSRQQCDIFAALGILSMTSEIASCAFTRRSCAPSLSG